MYEKFTGRNGNALYRKELEYLIKNGEKVSPRGKDTLEVQMVTTVLNPRERVLTVPGRANNPFFNVAENIAIIAGLKNQRDWFSQFNKQYLEIAHDTYTDGTFMESSWAFYGTRLRHYRFLYDKSTPERYEMMEDMNIDQLKEITRKLSADRDSRQGVAVLWNPHLDNIEGHKDYPCNFAVQFKIRQDRINMTVVNRSNDIHWGLFGVNLNQWSFIQEVMAAIIGVEVGHQTHLSDSLHLYLQEPHVTLTDNMMKRTDVFDIYEHTEATKMFDNQLVTWETLDYQLEDFFDEWNLGVYQTRRVHLWYPFLRDAWHFLWAYKMRGTPNRFAILDSVEDDALWLAGVEYMVRRQKYKITEELPDIQKAIRMRMGNPSNEILSYILSANSQNKVPAKA